MIWEKKKSVFFCPSLNLRATCLDTGIYSGIARFFTPSKVELAQSLDGKPLPKLDTAESCAEDEGTPAACILAPLRASTSELELCLHRQFPTGREREKTMEEHSSALTCGQGQWQQPSLHLPIDSWEGGWAGANLYPPWWMLLGVKRNSLWIRLGFTSESSAMSMVLTWTAAGENERQRWGWHIYAKGACYIWGELKVGWFCEGKNERMMERHEWVVVLEEVWWRMHTDTSVIFQVLGRKEKGRLRAFISVLSICHCFYYLVMLTAELPLVNHLTQNVREYHTTYGNM